MTRVRLLPLLPRSSCKSTSVLDSSESSIRDRRNGELEPDDRVDEVDSLSDGGIDDFGVASLCDGDRATDYRGFKSTALLPDLQRP